MSGIRLRAVGDKRLSEKLQAHPVVRSVVQGIEREAEKGTLGTRRRLLATSLRLTDGMAPTLAPMVRECQETLAMDGPVEIFVYPSASFNAAAVKPEHGRFILMFSSSLLECFDEGELRYVVGHELGHHLYDHHSIPIGPIIQGKEPAPKDLVLELFAWSRYAEISADRAGALCAGGPKPVGSALFRLASGFRGRELNMDIDEFASQVDAMKDAEAGLRKGALQGEWFSTHPFSPLRVKAVRAFFRSELFAKEAQSDAALEADVQSLMALMEPSYLDGKTDDAEAMRRLLFVAGLKVARAHDGIAEKEIEVFERLLGDDVFPDDLKPERADALIDERVPRVLELTTEGQRLQLIRDLGLIAHADGDFSLEERAVITDLAARLELEPLSVERTVGALGELD